MTQKSAGTSIRPIVATGVVVVSINIVRKSIILTQCNSNTQITTLITFYILPCLIQRFIYLLRFLFFSSAPLFP